MSKDYLEFSVNLRDVADKLVEGGDPDATITFFNHLAEAVAAKCGQQYSDHGMRYEIFWKQRVMKELTTEAEQFFGAMTRFLLS